jgi:hypothetical protein
LDKLAEQQTLTSQEIERRKMLSLQLEQTWRIEEIKARQRSRDREIKEGDMNTTYFFFAKANQRKRKKAISCLVEDGVEISDNKGMVDHAMRFYNTLFGEEPRQNIKLNIDFWQDGDKVQIDENESLEADFSEEEVS